jgi:ribosomal protein L37AE/L43A
VTERAATEGAATEGAATEVGVTDPAPRKSAVHGAARPYYCPFCGEEDLRPHPAAHAAWLCRGCTRVFTLTLIGLEAWHDG